MLLIYYARDYRLQLNHRREALDIECCEQQRRSEECAAEVHSSWEAAQANARTLIDLLKEFGFGSWLPPGVSIHQANSPAVKRMVQQCCGFLSNVASVYELQTQVYRRQSTLQPLTQLAWQEFDLGFRVLSVSLDGLAGTSCMCRTVQVSGLECVFCFSLW